MTFDSMFFQVQSTPYSLGYASLANIAFYNVPYAAIRNRLGDYVLPSEAALQAPLEDVLRNGASKVSGMRWDIWQLYIGVPSAYPLSFPQYFAFRLPSVEADCCITSEVVAFVD